MIGARTLLIACAVAGTVVPSVASADTTLRATVTAAGGEASAPSGANGLVAAGQPSVGVLESSSGTRLHVGFVVPSAQSLPDADGDGVRDTLDNCTEVHNPDQVDFDAGRDDDSSLPGVQHYGDACDLDGDDDGVVGPSDFFGFFRPCLGQDPALAPECAAADRDGDGVIGPADFFAGFRPALGSAPGPGTTEP